jgi:hypothetical protein
VTVVIAQGAGADWLRQKASASPSPSLLILPLQPYKRLAEVLASSDVLLTLLDSECGSFAVPSKVLAYMCAGRSQLIAAPLENLASKIIGRAGAGIATAAEADAFLQAAVELQEQPHRLQGFATNARTYAERTFCIEQIGNEMLHVIAFCDARVRRQAAIVQSPVSASASSNPKLARPELVSSELSS